MTWNVDVTWPKVEGVHSCSQTNPLLPISYPPNDDAANTALTNCAAHSGNNIRAKHPCHGTPGNRREQSVWQPGRTSGHCWDTCHFEKVGWLWLQLGAGPIPVGMGWYGWFLGLVLGRGARLHHRDPFFLQVLWWADITMDDAPCVCVQVWISQGKAKIRKKMPWVAPKSPKQINRVLFQTRNQTLPEHTHYSGSHQEGSRLWNGISKSHLHLHITWDPGENQVHNGIGADRGSRRWGRGSLEHRLCLVLQCVYLFVFDHLCRAH